MRDVVESLTDERIAVAVVELVAPLGKHAVFTTFTRRLQHQRRLRVDALSAVLATPAISSMCVMT